jgi:hypothetical protein
MRGRATAGEHGSLVASGGLEGHEHVDGLVLNQPRGFVGHADFFPLGQGRCVPFRRIIANLSLVCAPFGALSSTVWVRREWPLRSRADSEKI